MATRVKDAWEAFKRSARMSPSNELQPSQVLADLLGGGDFPAEVIYSEGAAAIILRRPEDAGFEVVPARRQHDDMVSMYDETLNDANTNRT